MGNTIQVPTISHLPDQDTGWVANEFKEYNKHKKEVVQIYKTLDRLGKGGFGAVYKVQETLSAKIYALKYIPSDAWEPAKKEATLMMGLQHPTIVKVYSFFPLYDPRNVERIIAFCIVMDFVEGQNLRDAMHNASESIPKHLVMEWFIKILEALTYLHERKIFHRDIKPENIIIKMDGAKFDVILVDFGLAMQGSLLSNNTQITVAGTFPYLSPDLLASGGRAPLNGKADIWALGCILYEIWTQDSSFVLKPMGMAGRFISEPNFLDKLDDISISQVLSYMLRADPNDRISAAELLNSDAIKGWQAAIDSSHPDRNTCPRSAIALLPYLSIVKDKSSPISHCLANLVFISRWQKIQDFQRVLIDFNLASTLINLMDHYASNHSFPKSSTLPLFAMCSKILTALISNVLGDLVAYQICSNPVGIQVLLRSNVFDVILRLLHINFGFSTLKNHFALEHYIHELMFTGTDEQIRGAVVLYEDLPQSSIPLNVYLNSFVKYVKEPAKQLRNITDLLYNHEDISSMLADPIAYSKIRDIISTNIYSQSEYTERLLGALLRVILPRPIIPYTDSINHGVCTAYVTGTHKYYQYMWVCRTCNTSVCLVCAKRCHVACKGEFISAVARCRCTGISKQGCDCAIVHDLTEIHNNNAEIHSRTRGGVANFSFFPNKDVLLPPPHDGIQVGSLLRFWEGSQELKVPPYSPSKTEPKFFFRNKGIHFVPNQPNSSILTTAFYYEISILAPAVGPNASICVGLSIKENAPKDNEMVGWNVGWAYHGDDGKRLSGKRKGIPYGPIFCMGDRVGCGVFSDGTVFFTLNGYFLGPFPNEEPRVPLQTRIFSTVSICGFDAHIKFHFEPSSFLFNPTPSFEPVTFFKNLPLLYSNLNLLRDSFGSNNRKIIDLIITVDYDSAATLINALTIGNPNLANDIKHHPIYDKILSSTSYASTLLQLATRDIYGDILVHKRISSIGSRENSMMNLKAIDKPEHASSEMIKPENYTRSQSGGFFNQPIQGMSNSIGPTTSTHRLSSHQGLHNSQTLHHSNSQNSLSNSANRSPREISKTFDVNFSSYSPSELQMSSKQQENFQNSPPFSSQISASPSHASPPSWGMDSNSPRFSFSPNIPNNNNNNNNNNRASVNKFVPSSPTAAQLVSANYDHALMENIIKAMHSSNSYTQSQATYYPSASQAIPLTLHVSMAGDLDDLRELVLFQDQLSYKAMTAALCELFEDVFPEGRAIAKIMKDVNSATVKEVKLVSDKSIQALKQHDKIVVHFA